MTRSALFVTLAAMLLSLWLAAGPTSAAIPESAPLDDGSVLVRFVDGLPEEQVRIQLAAAGLRAVRRIPHIDVWVAQPLVAATDTAATLGQLDASTAVLWAEENGRVTAQDTLPDDPRYAEQWPLPLIGAPGAWDLAHGMTAPIAIVDSGLDLDHGDLQAKLWRNVDEVANNGLDDDGNGYVDDVFGYDLVDGDGWPQDEYGHGSHVASIAGAAANNALGVAGVAWDTPLMVVRVLNATGEGNTADLAEGILYAADQGASIINLSLGYIIASSTVEASVDYALDQGCLLVAAVGNQDGTVRFPARLDGVLGVSATTSADTVWDQSNQGTEVDLAAPGEAVLGCNHLGGWVLKTGTSMAAPHVSAVAALVWGLRPELSSAQVVDILLSTAVDIGDEGADEYSGAGRVSAVAAVEKAVCRYRHALPLVARH